MGTDSRDVKYWYKEISNWSRSTREMNDFSLISDCSYAVGTYLVKDYCWFVLKGLLQVPADLTSEKHPGKTLNIF